jgi:hypothetical protein
MEKECKVTARIEPELYVQIQEKFYHGQQTLFFRNVFKSLFIIIKLNRFNEVTDYLYKGKALTLPPIDGED